MRARYVKEKFTITAFHGHVSPAGVALTGLPTRVCALVGKALRTTQGHGKQNWVPLSLSERAVKTHELRNFHFIHVPLSNAVVHSGLGHLEDA